MKDEEWEKEVDQQELRREKIKERGDQVAKRFPILFWHYNHSRKGKIREPLNYGLEIDAGWLDLLEQLCEKLDGIAKNHGVTITALQIKEKFGTLRFYYSLKNPKTKKALSPIEVSLFSPDGGVTRMVPQADDPVQAEINQAIREAEAESAVTCEICGQPGILRSGGWIRCLCDGCNVRERA